MQGITENDAPITENDAPPITENDAGKFKQVFVIIV